MIGVVGLAYWAYHQGYQTREAMREVKRLRHALGAAHQELNVLQAEWAYLNRPDRLRALVEMNFEQLGLMELTPEQLGTVSQISYSPKPSEPEKHPKGRLFDLDITDIEETSVTWSANKTLIIEPTEAQIDPELLP